MNRVGDRVRKDQLAANQHASESASERLTVADRGEGDDRAPRVVVRGAPHRCTLGGRTRGNVTTWNFTG